MLVNPLFFGLSPTVKVEFFDKEQAGKITGAFAGYNAVYEISPSRVRYELLRQSAINEYPEYKPETTKTPVAAPAPKKAQQQPATTKKSAPEEKKEEPAAPAEEVSNG